MPRERFYDVLEECLGQLKKGVELEDVLAQHQEVADELRPLLEAVLLAQPSHAQAPGLTTAQNRSRARFLGAASQRKPVSVFSTLKLASMLVAAAIALAAVVFTASLVGSGLASAKAVPGQTLYPVKRAVEQAQLALTTSQVNKIELEESFDERRAQETEQLIHTGQTENVQFAGFLHEDPQAGWVVNQSLLILTPEQEALAQSLNGSYVEVSGTVLGEAGVQVNNLQLRVFQVNGLLESVQADQWVVSGINVQIQASTKIMGNPRPGARVEISALRLSDGQFQALSVKVKQSGAAGESEKDKKDKDEKKGENPEPEVTVQTEDDVHGGGKGQETEDPESAPENELQSTPEPESYNNSIVSRLTGETKCSAEDQPLQANNFTSELTAVNSPD